MTFLLSGGVYWLPDKDLSLPPEDDRRLHDRRTVVVVSSRESIADTSWNFALIVPTSTQEARATPFCVELAKGEGNLSRQTWARVPAVQPVMKAALTEHVGQISPNKLDDIRARLALYLGMLD